MPRASKRRRSEIVDTINAALEIVDDVAQDEDGELVRAVVAGFALNQISDGNYEDDREDEDEDQAPEDDEEEQEDEEEEPIDIKRVVIELRELQNKEISLQTHITAFCEELKIDNPFK